MDDNTFIPPPTKEPPAWKKSLIRYHAQAYMAQRTLRQELEEQLASDALEAIEPASEVSRQVIKNVPTELDNIVDTSDPNQGLDEAERENFRQRPRRRSYFTDDKNDIVITKGQDSEDGSIRGRTHSLEDVINLDPVKTSNLHCLLCRLDMTASVEAKNRLWILSELDEHLKGSYHTREQELKRAFEHKKARSGSVRCNLCKSRPVIESGLKLIEHHKRFHPDQLKDLAELNAAST